MIWHRWWKSCVVLPPLLWVAGNELKNGIAETSDKQVSLSSLAGNIRRRRAKTLSTWHEYVYRSTDRLQNLSWYLSADRPLILGVLYYGANPNIVHRAIVPLRLDTTTTTSSCHLDLLDRPHCSFEIANRHWHNNSSAIEVEIFFFPPSTPRTRGESRTVLGLHSNP
jgi:hypothetical protein